MTRATYWVWRRELQITLRAPILYVIGGLFLIVQGIAFAGLVNALSDPRRPAPLGALLEGQLSGTLLTWVLQLVVLTLLGMRTIADEKRNGGWELLLTARVGEAAAVIGKWLAAVTIYALLWLPTLAYLAIVAMFRSDTGGWDIASIVSGYAGAIALGGALLAWTVAASAATSTPLAAGAVGFAILIGLFLVGELPTVWPDLGAASVLGKLALREQLTLFARGEVGVSNVWFVVGLAIVGLSLAITFACAGRRRRIEVRNRTIATVLLAAIAILGGVLGVRHPMRWDVSASHRNSLDPETRRVLAAMPGPATLTIVEPTLGALGPLYDEVARVADRMAEIAPITVRRIDPIAVPGGLEAAARTAGVPPSDLASNGGVVVELAGRKRVVDRLQIAAIEVNAHGPEIQRLAIEQAIAGAIATLSSPAAVNVCATTGHGELPLVDKVDKDADWTAVADRLRAEGMVLEVLSLAHGVPERCHVLLVIGPVTPLSSEEALAVQAFIARGRGVLVAAASRLVGIGDLSMSSVLSPTGLESVLGAEGLGLPPAIAVDPASSVRELPGALLIIDGYTPHPINEGFAATRATLWFQPRVVIASGPAQPLVHASAASWGERDLHHAPPHEAPDDIAGPAVLAAIGAHRVIAIGSAESFATSLLGAGPYAGDLWIAHAIRFLAGQPEPKVAVGARSPEQVRLVMSAAERRAVIALSTAGIPLLWIVVGGAVLLWRRRRDR